MSLRIEKGSLFSPLTPKTRATIVIDDGRIAKIIPTQDVTSDAGLGNQWQADEGSQKSTLTIDISGATVLPGLIDSHCHLVALGRSRRELDLSGAASITNIRTRVSGRTARARKGEWIVGAGWDQERFHDPTRLPSRDDIDDVTPANPVLLYRVCRHVGLVNTRALRELGLEPPGMRRAGEAPALVEELFERDEAGRLTGIIRESALVGIAEKLPVPSPAEIEQDILTGQLDAAKNGVTAVHCILSGDYAREIAAFNKLNSDHGLQIRCRLYAPIEALDYLRRTIQSPGGLRLDGEMVRLNGVKIFADGSLGARTAALFEPYDDDPSNSGILRYSDDELFGLVDDAAASGYQVIVHAIGDRAIDQALRAFERPSANTRKRRHRIEHASVAPSGLIARARDAGVTLSVQPHFVVTDSWAPKRLGESRARDLYPFKSMLSEMGERMSAGSDAPVEPISPLMGISAAISRGGDAEKGSTSTPSSDDDTKPAPKVRGVQGLSVREAIRLYTANAARAGFDEEVLGDIKEGMWGDITLVDQEIQEDEHPALLRRARVLATIVAGIVVYSAGLSVK